MLFFCAPFRGTRGQKKNQNVLLDLGKTMTRNEDGNQRRERILKGKMVEGIVIGRRWRRESRIGGDGGGDCHK